MNYRFHQKNYTEADISALFMKYREERIGPFVREVGDFIAHPERKKGATLSQTVFMFSQGAFFQTYQGTNKVALNCVGDCPWWLMHWFLCKVDEEKMSKLKRISGMTKKA